MRIRFYLPALFVLVFLAPGLGARAEEGRVFQSLKAPFQVVIIASGLDHPWSMAFLPDGDLLVTERSGELRLIRKGRLQDKPIKGLPEITDKRDQGGLLDVALDPGFDQNGRLCISYVAETEAGRGTEIGCGIFRDDRLVNFDVIFRAVPKNKTGRHFGCRLLFANGYLFATLGDKRLLAFFVKIYQLRCPCLHTIGHFIGFNTSIDFWISHFSMRTTLECI